MNQLIADIETLGHFSGSLVGRFESARSGREPPAGRFDPCCDFILVGEVQLIFTGEHLMGEVARSIVGDSSVPLRAEDQPYWRVLMRMGPLLAGSDIGSSGPHPRL